MEFSGPGVNDVGLSIVKSNKLSRKIVWVEFPVEFGGRIFFGLDIGDGVGFKARCWTSWHVESNVEFPKFFKAY